MEFDLVVHATHEAGVKMGGIGAVLEGLLGAQAYNERIAHTILVGTMDVRDAVQMERMTAPRNRLEIYYSSHHGIDQVSPALGAQLETIESDYGVQLLYGYRAGLDLETVMQSVASGAAGSWSLSNLGTRIIANNFDPGFFVEHFIKDMGIALEESKRMGLSMPGLALAHQLYLALQAQGHGRDGTHALHLALASMSDVDWKNR